MIAAARRALASRGRRRRGLSLRALPLVGAVVRTYQDGLTGRGRALLWIALGLGLVGVDTRRSQIYVLFAMAAGALAVALLTTMWRPPPRGLSCALPTRATALAPLTLGARIDPDGRGRTVHLRFPPPARWGSSIRFEPSEALVAVGADEPGEVSVAFRALRRGRYELRGPILRSCDPLFLATGRGRRLPDQALLVYPRFYRMDDFVIPLGRRYQPGGIPLTSSTGDAIEFVGTRDYREGDAIKNIHWRSWARRGQPVVKEYQEEYFCRIAIILDTFLPRRARPVDERGFEAAVSVVASIADHFSRSEYIVDILAAGPDVYEVSAGRSLAYLENILDVLACLEPCADPPFSGIGPALFDRLAQITTVVAVLQDWDEPRQAFLRQVRALGTAVRVIVVREGETARPWAVAADEIGEIGVMTPTDVERSLAAGEAARG